MFDFSFNVSDLPCGAALRNNHPSDTETRAPLHRYFDMPALKAYMASDSYKDASAHERSVCEAAIVDEALESSVSAMPKQCASLRDSNTPRYSIEELARIVQDEYPDGTTEHGTPAPKAEQVQAALETGSLFVKHLQELDNPVLLLQKDAELGQAMLDMHDHAAHVALDLMRNPAATTPWFAIPYTKKATS